MKPLLVRALAVVIFLAMTLTVVLPAFSQQGATDQPWSHYEWSPIFTVEETGEAYYLAESSVYKLPHAPSQRSFYLKVLFANVQEEDMAPFNIEISDMFMDCRWGQIDVLSVNRYLDEFPVGRKKYRQEQAAFIQPGSTQEKLFHVICPEPEFKMALAEQEKRKKIRGSEPWLHTIKR